MSVGALGAYQILDLSDERGQLCGALLASLGADVIAIEPPGGTRARHLSPRTADGTGAWHWAYNRGKRSIELDLERADDRERFLELVAQADALVESAAPGELDALGLSAEVLAERNPALVHVSITPYGSDGPRSGWAATDLTVVASTGVLRYSGDEDRAPTRVSVPQAFFHASIDATWGLLVALHERAVSGRGQHLDVSAQQSFALAGQSQILADVVGHQPPERGGGANKGGGIAFRNVYQCADGHASVLFMFGPAYAPPAQRLLAWALEHGFGRQELVDENWSTFRDRLAAGTTDISMLEEVFGVLDAFVRTKTKDELLAAALERRLLVAPFATAAEVVDSEQLAARDYWEEVEGPDARTLRLPSAWVRASASPVLPLGPPPGLDEHRDEVLATDRTPATVAPAWVRDPADPRPLSGLKVLDFMWVMAGPTASRVLADAGATVVKVESAGRPDPIRSAGPFKDGIPAPDRSTLLQELNAGKSSISIDLSHPGAVDVVHDLVRWADVVCESFSGGAIDRLGFGYEALREVCPDLIMSSSCLMGQTGPHASLAGYGTMSSAIMGFGELAGWPDRDPVGPYGAYTDYIAPRFLITALLAALDHRARTGEGQYLDLSQAECGLLLIAPALIAAEMNGEHWGRSGNADLDMAPHGVYPASGDDDWIALACRDDGDWAALAELLDRADLAVLTEPERRRRQGELDDLVAGFTAGLGAHEAVDRLQRAGVPSAVVARSFDCFADEQLQARQHFRLVPSTSYVDDMVWLEGPRVRLSRTPLEVAQGAPALGADTRRVLTDALGYSEDAVDQLAADGVLR